MTLDNTMDKVEVRKDYYESGALLWEIPYVNGRKHGIEKAYHESGALWIETPYVNGKIHGIEKWYYTSGALLWEIPYVNGDRHGIKRDYDKEKMSICSLTLYDKGQTIASIKPNI